MLMSEHTRTLGLLTTPGLAFFHRNKFHNN